MTSIGNCFRRDTCRLCDSRNLKIILHLTPTALCDAYVPAHRVNLVQEVYPLDLYLCTECGYIHLPYVVDPEIIYRDYIYVTTSSLGLAEHFKKYASDVMKKLKPFENELIIDIGSNDGTLLRYFKNHGMRVLGIEPATEIARRVTESGIETIPEFFNSALSDKILISHERASIITINNLFANIDDLKEIVNGVRKLLTPNGVFIIESSYVSDMIKNMVFDFIYHEHLSYFSVKPLHTFFRRFNMEMFDIEHTPTKGGSLRYYVQLSTGNRSVMPIVSDLISYEENIGLYQTETYKAFSDKINNRKEQLRNKLQQLKKEKKTIAGYGGSATTTTFLYHFGIREMIDYIVDDNPAKQYTFSPGYHIPVLPSDVLYERKPDYVVVFAWRFFEPIVKKHQAYLDHGGRFIRPLPDFEILQKECQHET